MTKSKLLVVGDSFFSVDHHLYGNTFSKWKGHHWSEKLSEFEVLNHSLAGSSNAMIQHALVTKLMQYTDISAIVIGFTGIPRIEFKNDLSQPQVVPDEYKWYTSVHKSWLTSDQKLLSTLYDSISDNHIESIKHTWAILGTLHFLKSLNIPFVYSLGIFELIMQHSDFKKPDMLRIVDQFSQFDKNKIDFNLATYPNEKMPPRGDPLFHVPDPDWQQKFANEVTTKLKTIDTQSDSLL